jgi:4-carboxymuconolactone decarboxylase
MQQFPVLSKEDLNDEQRELWDVLTTGPRGFYTGGPNAERLPDLYNAWMQFPQFGHLMLGLGDAIRACTELTGRHRELIVLTTSARLKARVEFDFHVPFARNEGISDAVIAAIGNGQAAHFECEEDRIIHQANVQFLDAAALSEQTRSEVIGMIGFAGLIQLIAAISLYVITAYTTSVANVQLAKDFSADPNELTRFFAGRGPAPSKL